MNTVCRCRKEQNLLLGNYPDWYTIFSPFSPATLRVIMASNVPDVYNIIIENLKRNIAVFNLKYLKMKKIERKSNILFIPLKYQAK